MDRVAGILLVSVLLITSAHASEEISGIWQGAIELPTQSLQVEVELQHTAGELSGDIDIPAQSAKDLPLTRLKLTDNNLVFTIQGVPGEPTFAGAIDASSNEITGIFTQNGGSFPFMLSKADPRARAQESLADFADVARQAVSDFNVAGIGIAVVYKGEILLAEGVGQRDVEGDLPMDADTLFAIGSTTKAMTATVLGMLADDGQVAFDEPVRTYLPSFELADPRISDVITVRDLVTHRSGMPRHDMAWYNYNEGTRAEMVSRLAHMELTADLRERFQYNNLMFMTAGYLAATVAGEDSWEQLMQSRLMSPLGMKRTNFSVSNSLQDDNHAKPHKYEDEELERIPFRPLDLIGPAGSVNSSVREMAQWLKFNLAGGKVNGEQLLQTTTLADLQSHHMPTGQASTVAEISAPVYAMGWMVDTYRGKRRLHHGGGIDGFITSVMLFPDDDLGLVAFSNTASNVSQWLNLAAADRVLGFDDKDWLGEALQRQEATKDEAEAAAERADPRRKKGTKPSRAVDAFAGDYLHPGYGPLKIDKDRRGLRALYNNISIPLEHWHYDVWQGDKDAPDPALAGQKFLFAPNLHGEIASVSVSLEPAGAPIVFARQPAAELFDGAYLATLAGDYASPLAKVSVVLQGSKLVLSVPGQPAFTLVPELGGRFSFQRIPQVTVQFNAKKNSLTVVQPGSVIEAVRSDS